MPMFDFRCSKGHEFEEICSSDEKMTCPKCGEAAEKVWNAAPPVLTHIIPDYPGSKRFKAGYQHTSHADQSATRVQSGYGGMCNPTV